MNEDMKDRLEKALMDHDLLPTYISVCIGQLVLSQWSSLCYVLGSQLSCELSFRYTLYVVLTSFHSISPFFVIKILAVLKARRIL